MNIVPYCIVHVYCPVGIMLKLISDIVLFFYQVAKAEGGSNAANQVAYLWAKSLGTCTMYM